MYARYGIDFNNLGEKSLETSTHISTNTLTWQIMTNMELFGNDQSKYGLVTKHNLGLHQDGDKYGPNLKDQDHKREKPSASAVRRTAKH